MLTPNLHGANRTDIDCLLAMSDSIVKGKKTCWHFICYQYADVFKNQVSLWTVQQLTILT